MAWRQEASVIHRGGCDYWRTWYLEECEAEQLFGITRQKLGITTLSGPGYSCYKEGSEIYLEDAPYFSATHTHHRICGPYNIKSIQLPPGAESVHEVDGKVIVYKEKHPEAGPWFDRSRVTRIIDGVKASYPQEAVEFGYYPYRFGIKKSSKYRIQHIEHNKLNCWLCDTSRKWAKWRR